MSSNKFNEDDIEKALECLSTDGDNDALRVLWDRFFEPLVRSIESRAKRLPRTLLDGEDIAIEVFGELWRYANEGRLTSIKDRDEFWAFLLAVSYRKLISHVRRETSARRGGTLNRVTMTSGLDTLVGSAPSPDVPVEFSDEIARLLAILNNDLLRKIATMKIEGNSNHEIASKLSIASATLTRKLKLINGSFARQFREGS